MKMTLRVKLTLSFISIALVSVFLTGIMANLLLEKQFQMYIRSAQETKNQELVNHIANQYAQKKQWDPYALQQIGLEALEQGLIIKVADNKERVLWDAVTYNSGMCQAMMEQFSKTMEGRYSGWKGAYEEKKYPLTVDGKAVGTVIIGYYGPFFYNKDDVAFINTLNTILFWIGIAALAFATVLGIVISDRISKPIAKVTHMTHRISKGDYGIRMEQESNTLETQQLSAAINGLAEALKNQEDLRKQLTSDVAHELRTPLATLQSHLEALADGIWEATPERFNSLREEVERMSRLVENLAKLSEWEQAEPVLTITELDLHTLSQTIYNQFAPEFEEKQLNAVLEGSSVLVKADRDKISQVIINLISNALKHTQTKGTLLLRTFSEDNDAILQVQDSGTGIPREEWDNIFERFYRVDPSRTRLTGGTGIGLSIAKAIIEAHGGMIGIKESSPKGTIVEFRLPLSISEEKADDQ